MTMIDPGISVRQLKRELSVLGLYPGAIVLIHCSMRQLRSLSDGPATLYDALREIVGDSGTIVVPAQTVYNSNTSPVFRNATKGMNPAQIAAYEDTIPGFDAQTTPSYQMGAFAEYVRLQPGARRSAHPQASFAAVGPEAGNLMREHEFESHLGERSPMAALYSADAMTLLLGVGYESCTALHLAEYRRGKPPELKRYRCYVMENGERKMREFDAPDVDPTSFPRIGAELDLKGFVISGEVAGGPARFMPIQQTVDFAISWMDEHQQTASTY